ncbi:MAG: ABC transporter permease, partial [Asticcacaulis sp.]|nr:ABC transporter permease [Asticcacaulis sp.]
MRKTLLIARREYLAFIRTVGFWLSLVTAPLIFACVIAVPMLIRQTEPVQTLNVAVLDLAGGQLERPIRDLLERRDDSTAGQDANQVFIHSVGRAMAREDIVRVVPLPAALSPAMGLKDAEARIPGLLTAPDSQVSNVIIAYDDGRILHFHIWSRPKQRQVLQDKLFWDLQGLQYYKLASLHGVDPQVAHDMRDTPAQVISLTAQPAEGAQSDDFAAQVRDNGPRILGAVMGYISWMSIFSSSMILLGGVIEEKASKVLEVLLASVSTESLLVGKVLGVASVLATVAAIWGVAGFAAFSYIVPILPPVRVHAILAGLGPMFAPDRIALLITYFCGGYLMFGVTFAAIGAFCETQKDAQAVMGPIMIV